jgi:hypothetical protein
MSNTLKIITTLIFLSFTLNANAIIKGTCVVGNCKNGKGTVTSANDYTYTGDFVNGEWSGKGTFTFADVFTYTGDWVNGKMEGKGTASVVNGYTYTGDFVNDEMAGKGTYTYADGTIESGYFVNNKYWGTVAEWDTKVAKEKAYDTIYSACLVDKGSDIDMQVDVLKKAVMNECSSIAEDPTWFENFKYN